MEPKILLLTNHSFFTFMALRGFEKRFQPIVRNLRYANEQMTPDAQYIRQLDDIFQQGVSEQRSLPPAPSFSLTEPLLYRIEQTIDTEDPSLIVYDMTTMEEVEWQLLSILKQDYELPIVVYTKEEHVQGSMARLLSAGVREVITQLDPKKLESIGCRYLGIKR